jgi:hypothetical protein
MQMIKQNMRKQYFQKPHALLREVQRLPTTVVTRFVDPGGTVTGVPLSFKFQQEICGNQSN